jgi:CheY-like chemotaxis protein
MTIMREEHEKEGGDLGIAVTMVTADDDFIKGHPEALPGTTYIKTSVSDTGVGIHQENIHKIFEPFFTTKDRDRGTGLGLSMVQNIVKMHEGFIEVDSAPGKGTVMSVYIPKMEPRASSPGPSWEEGIVKGIGTILIIDDEETIITVAEEFLNSFGYRTLPGHGALDGLDAYRRGHASIDLVLLDLSMPVMSGYDVFLELKKINPGVKVLLSSGFAHDERVQKILDNGALGFIAKPYSRIILSQKVREILT